MYNTTALLSIRFLLVCRQENHLTWNVAYRRHSMNVWWRQWHPTPVLLPVEYHGRRSLVGCSSWGWRVSNDWMTSLSLSCIGEGNGNSLQCSCLENPMDRGAWWAAVYGVEQCRTWLKRLSRSSSSSSNNECLVAHEGEVARSVTIWETLQLTFIFIWHNYNTVFQTLV